MSQSDDDKILEESAALVQRQFRSMPLERTERDADSAGLRARSMGSGDMNGGRKFENIPANAPGDILAAEQQANRAAVEARRKIIESGEMGMEDFISLGMTGNDKEREEARALSQMVGYMVDRGASRVVRDAYVDPNDATDLMEQHAYSPRPQEGWNVVKRQATLNSGKVIPVFLVEDSVSGMTTGKRYRIAEIAEKVARVLNTTNNPNDPRIGMIDEAYEKHVELRRTIGQIKREMGQGNTSRGNRLSVLESRLQEVNAKLGLD